MAKNQNEEEIYKFSKLAEQWWDPKGKFKPLHLLNPVRSEYIENVISGFYGKEILDIGCGGGILSETMARAGASVTAIDLSEPSLNVAKIHAEKSNLDINYIYSAVEDYVALNKEKYDVITCLEMLEHVPDPASVIRCCRDLLKPNGIVFFSTINRNLKSFVQAIIGAEYILNILPRGTHQYASLIKPSELVSDIEDAGLKLVDITGISYNPFTDKVKLTDNVDINYMLYAQKNG